MAIKKISSPLSLMGSIARAGACFCVRPWKRASFLYGANPLTSCLFNYKALIHVITPQQHNLDYDVKCD